MKKLLVLGFCFVFAVNILQGREVKRIKIILERHDYPLETKDMLILDADMNNTYANKIYKEIKKAKRIPFGRAPKCILEEERYKIIFTYNDNKEHSYDLYCETAMFDEAADRYAIIKSKNILCLIRGIVILRYHEREKKQHLRK